MTNYEEWRNEQLKDPKVRAEFEALRPEYEIAIAMAKARKRQKLTQQELALHTGISQADISRLENGTRNPSLNLLKRIAEGMNSTLEIRFVPKHENNR